MMFQEDCVIKRNGEKETISFDKILKRVKNLGYDQLNVNYTSLVQKIIDRLYDEIPTKQIDELTAQQCASLITTHQDYGILASRILVSNHQKNTPDTFYTAMKTLYHFKDSNEQPSPIISENLWNLTKENKDLIESMIDYKRDFLIDYFGFKTLERAYLMRVNKNIVERPQHMWMRVAIGIWGDNWEKVKKTYDGMSQKFFTHATPTLFNAGTDRSQLSSCYLLAMKDDSIAGIYETLSDCAKISKWAGGIGLHIHNVRAAGSHIRGTNGISNGIVPMLRVFNNTARYVDQCITPETFIYTTEGPKYIQDCDDSTFVFTTDKAERIQNVLEHPYEGEVYDIYTMHSIEPLTITDEHPVLSLRDQNNANYSLIKQRIKNNTIQNEWTEAKNIRKGDFLVFTIPSYEKNISTISEEDCYMYGLFLGDGCMNNKSTSTYISLNKNSKQYIIDFVKKYLEDRCVQYFETLENNTTRIRWNKNIILPFRYSDFYDPHKEKKIHSKWLNLPLEKAKYILKGLIDTDGCKGKELVFDTTSRNLLESVRYILLRMGIPSSGYIRDRRGESHVSKYGDIIENKKIGFSLRIPRTKAMVSLLDNKIEEGEFFKFFTYDNFIYTRVKSIEKRTYSGTLYDLQMKETHNYMIHNGVVHNGGGKRNGSFAIYMEPWHGDIMDFLDMKKNHGDEEARARDLFYALWIPDEFMRRVQKDEMWTLMCPDICRGLSDVYGEEFDNLYRKYERDGKGIKQVKARSVWFKILDSQIETGTPYMLYKDAANIKSNQKNLGTIKSSNLCTEIIEYSSEDQTAVCNLASIGLSNFVKKAEKNFEKVTIYTKNDCIYCKMTKVLCEENEINPNIIEVPPENRDEFKSMMLSRFDVEVKTFPQIIIDQKYVGGYDQFSQKLQPVFDYEKLHEITKTVTDNLNKVIDINFYPTEKTLRSNMLHRPIGLGVQGLADALALLDIPFHSEEAKTVNRNIFETIYHAALERSNEIAMERQLTLVHIKNKLESFGYNIKALIEKSKSHETFQLSYPNEEQQRLQKTIDEMKINWAELNDLDEERAGAYSSFIGSPASKGILQFDMWGVESSSRFNWTDLKNNIIRYGLRNSLLVAPMPTASTSQILGNNECFEPFTSNIYSRRTIAGEFIIVNKHLMKELMALGKWNNEVKNSIIAHGGSVQQLDIPKRLKEKYKIVWEIPMKHVLDMAKDRGAFICQSQSLNLWMKDPDYKKLTAMHMYAWKLGLKTGIYYLRTKAKAAAQQFTIEPPKGSTGSSSSQQPQEEEECLMCGA